MGVSNRTKCARQDGKAVQRSVRLTEFAPAFLSPARLYCVAYARALAYFPRILQFSHAVICVRF